MTEQPPQGPAQPPQNPYQPYGAPAPGGVPYWAPDHPQSTTVLILGILGLSLCQLVAPFAWVIGGRVKKEIDANPAQYGGRSQVQIGYVLGIVGTALLGFYLLFGLVYIGVIVAAVSAGA